MDARAEIFLEPGEADFGGLGAATDCGPTFEDENFVSCFCEVSGTDQAVVPRAGDYEIEAVARCWLLGPAEGGEGERRECSSAFDETASGNFTHDIGLFLARALAEKLLIAFRFLNQLG